jgi:hypothetical protein
MLFTLLFFLKLIFIFIYKKPDYKPNVRQVSFVKHEVFLSLVLFTWSQLIKIRFAFNKIFTVKPVYKWLAYNWAYRLHRSHRFLNQMIGYNEKSLFTNGFGRTDLFVINKFNCIYLYVIVNTISKYNINSNPS